MPGELTLTRSELMPTRNRFRPRTALLWKIVAAGFLGLLAWPWAAPAEAAPNRAKPNFIVILIDDKY